MLAFRQISCLTRAPAAMEKFFYRRKEDFVRKQTDNNAHKHDGNDLIHRAQFPSVMQKLTKAETGKDRHKDFRRHQRAPGKSPTLFHAADDEWQRRREDDRQPDMQAFRTHRERRASIDRRNISHTSFGGDND